MPRGYDKRPRDIFEVDSRDVDAEDTSNALVDESMDTVAASVGDFDGFHL